MTSAKIVWKDCGSIKYQVVEQLEVGMFDPCCSSAKFEKRLKRFKKRGTKPKLLLAPLRVGVGFSSSSNK